MRLLVFHGYLLHGTGSNVYNARLVRALAARGHEVDLLSQDPDPLAVDGVDAVGSFEDGRAVAPEGRVVAWRPPIGRVLPVYVADRYEGFDAVPFTELGDDAVEAYVAANVAAVRAVVAARRPEAALANHAVMGPRILAEALEDDVPYAVKIHGSALEYTVKAQPERFLASARRGLGPAQAVLVGSRHTAESLWAALGDEDLPAKTRLGPPGVDVEAFRPRPLAEAAAAVRAVGEALAARPAPAGEPTSFVRDEPAVGRALLGLDLAAGPHVVFTGKLIRQKGVHLLLEAWERVRREHPAARLVVVGFGGDEAELRAMAGEGVAFTGRLEHAELAPLLAACTAQVVPSVFPEAFGMVAAEAAACGTLPVVAGHSGLAEVARPLAAAVPAEAADLLAYDPEDDPVAGIATRLVRWLGLDEAVRARTREALVRVARERYSWEGVADGVAAAAIGRLDALPPPG